LGFKAAYSWSALWSDWETGELSLAQLGHPILPILVGLFCAKIGPVRMEKTNTPRGMTSRRMISPERSCCAIFINRDIYDFSLRDFDALPGFFASFSFDNHLDGYGGSSFTEHARIKAYHVTDIDRRYKTDFSHRSGDEISWRLPRSGNRTGQVNMTQYHSAEDSPVRVGIPREHGHPQCGFSKLSHQRAFKAIRATHGPDKLPSCPRDHHR